MSNQIKKRLLFFSPFPPEKSGISDYSAVLVKFLSEYFEISLCLSPINIVNQGLYNIQTSEAQKKLRPDSLQKYKIYTYGVDPIPFQDFDRIIYCVGNNPYYHNYMYQACLSHPGLVILHDYVLFYLMVGHYVGNPKMFIKKSFEIGGLKALLLFADLALNFKNFLTCPYDRVLPMNKEILNSKNKIMVHSEHVKNKILSEFPNRINSTFKINMIDESPKPSFSNKHDLFKKYGVPENSFVISSFGHISETKLNDQICEATKNLNKKFSHVVYVMVGEGHFVDKYVDNNVIFKTGYTNLEEFASWIQFSDLVINLRYPSMGETSSALIRVLKEGRPCIVSDDAWFSEVPDDVVIKLKNPLRTDVLQKTICQLLENPEKLKEMSRNSYIYTRENYDCHKITKQIVSLLED